MRMLVTGGAGFIGSHHARTPRAGRHRAANRAMMTGSGDRAALAR